MTIERMLPPNCGWGWASTAAVDAESGTASSPSRARPSDVLSVTRSMTTDGDATVGFVPARDDSKQPIKMQSDRLLVQIPGADGERKSRGGILIPATAQLSKRLVWAEVVTVGPHVRNIEPGDQVLFNPEDRYEVEVRGEEYLILRERDIHAVASERIESGSTGLYL